MAKNFNPDCDNIGDLIETVQQPTDEQIKVGMTPWQVVAAYSLWEYTTDPSAARYKQIGALELWTLLDRRQTATAHAQPQEEWALQRHRNTRYLYFQKGTLTAWKD